MMKLQRLGLIGAGGMADTVLSTLAETLEAPLDFLSVLVLPEAAEAATAMMDRLGVRLANAFAVRTDLTGLLGDTPDLVVECAGHGAVRQYCAATLVEGIDFLAVSTGAFADESLHEAACAAAKEGGAQLFLSAGAVGGIDVLTAAALSGLTSVVYTGRKPPLAWRGTPAERLLDLAALREATTFFEGSARDAATDYPQNANVAATVALAGAGFAATKVRLIADPGIARNIHEITVESGCANFTIRLEGKASPANPKTSLTAGFSLAREILDRRAAFVI
jgi:aspartate dehydrogenase